MFTCTKETLTRGGHTPWGREVARRLAERGMIQSDLAFQVQCAGYRKFNTNRLNETMRGIGVSARMPQIRKVNEILGIPEDLQAEESEEPAS